MTLMVRSRGLEPPRVAPLAPQASASTSSATTACGFGGAGQRHGAEAGLDVTNGPHWDKGSGLRLPGPCPSVSALVRRPLEHLGHFNRNSVAVDAHVAFRNAQVPAPHSHLLL